MEFPQLFEPQTVDADTQALTAYLPVPGLGVLPANAFVIHAREPVLIDAGVVALAEPGFEKLCSAIDPGDLRWIWLTHTDHDHVGCLARLLEVAPKARVVTTFLGMGKLGLGSTPVPPERVYLLNPGQGLEVGDRVLRGLRPPCFDAPETTAVFDARTRNLFSSDCFGAVLPAPFESARDIPETQLQQGMDVWTQVDAPWLSWTDPGRFATSLRELRALQPRQVLSAHLPPAPGMLDALCEGLDRARQAPAFVGPDQQALEQTLAAS